MVHLNQKGAKFIRPNISKYNIRYQKVCPGANIQKLVHYLLDKHISQIENQSLLDSSQKERSEEIKAHKSKEPVSSTP